MRVSSFFDFNIANESSPCMPNPQDPLVQIFHDYHGKQCAYAYEGQGDYWLYFPYIASYRIGSNSNRITGYPEPLSNRERIQDVYSRIVFPIALHTHGTQALHASAVLSDHGVLAFCAMSETGKSTTAHALSQRGYPHWADDAVPFEITGESVNVLPLEFKTRIDSAAEKHLGNSRNVADHLQGSQTAPLCALFVLHRLSKTTDQMITTQRLSAPQAFRSVLLHAHFFNLASGELKRQMVGTYMKLTTLVPVFEIHFQPGFEKIHILLDEIEKILKSLYPV